MAQITLNSSGVASNGTLALQSNGTTTAVTIDTSQNVGVGTASPGVKLQVNGASSAISSGGEIVRVANNTGNYQLTFGSNNGSYNWIRSLEAGVGGVPLVFAGSSEAMRIDSSGNVGIGYTSPVTKLDVFGTIRAGSGSDQGTQLNMWTGAGGDGGIAAFTIGFYTGSNSARTQRMLIDSSGNVSIGGTVSTGILSPLRITISGNNGVPSGTGNGQGNVGTYTAYGLSLLGQGSSYDISFVNKSGSFAGYVATGATTITTSSDERLKENNQPITGALDAVCQMRHETGNYKSDPDRTVAFLIAQDVDKLFPYAVEKADPESWGVNYNWIIPLHGAAITELTALVQEQQAIITQLQADVAALKGTA